MNKRERFLEGVKRSKKAFRKWHGVNPDALERHPWDTHSIDYYREHPDWMKSTLGTYRKTRVVCSGPCCGNPRKWRGEVTRQEMKQNDKDKFTEWR